MSTQDDDKEKLAVVRVRGMTHVGTRIKETLNRLRLYKKMFCIVIPKTPAYLGMVSKIKDYVAYGEIDDTTLKLLIEKRQTRIKVDGKTIIRKFFRLNPPRHGFGRKGIKKAFSAGGALGYRGSAINDLIRRMV